MSESTSNRRTTDGAGEAIGDLFMAGIELDMPNFPDAYPGENESRLRLLARYAALLKKAGIYRLGESFDPGASKRKGDKLFISSDDFASNERFAQTLAVFGNLEDEAPKAATNGTHGPAGFKAQPGAGSRTRERVQQRGVPAHPAASGRLQVDRTRGQVQSVVLQTLRAVLPETWARQAALALSEDARKQLNAEARAAKPARIKLAEWFFKNQLTVVSREFARRTNRQDLQLDPLNESATKFRVSGTSPGGQSRFNTGYEIEISPLPPFELKVVFVHYWENKRLQDEVFHQTFAPKRT